MKGRSSAGNYEIVILIVVSSAGTLIATISGSWSKEIIRRAGERWSHLGRSYEKSKLLEVVNSKSALLTSRARLRQIWVTGRIMEYLMG